MNGDIYAFGGHDGTNPLDTIFEWNSGYFHQSGKWYDSTLKIPEAAENPTIIPYNFWEKCIILICSFWKEQCLLNMINTSTIDYIYSYITK